MNEPSFGDAAAQREGPSDGSRVSHPFPQSSRHPCSAGNRFQATQSPYVAGHVAGSPGPYPTAPASAYPTGMPYASYCTSHAYAGQPARPLDVIHVGCSLLRGGAEQWLVDLARFLDPRRVRLLRAIVTLPGLIDGSLVAELKVPVETGQADAVRRAARECDVLLCWGVELNEWLADCRPKLCVFVAHGDGDWTRLLMEQSRQVVDYVVAVSRSSLERCAAGVPGTVIWNGVDSIRLARTRSREAARQSLGFQPGDFVLGYVGRFSREKRPQVVIEAVSRLPDRFKALLLGWGELRNNLMELANEKIPGRYAFATAWEYLGDFYQAMDALCLVSDQEGFPLVMLEAMLCGRPLIVTPVGCVPEVIVDRVNGLVVAGDAASVAQAADLLSRCPDWARGVAAEGKAFADVHGHASRMARQYEDLLHKLWADRYGSPAPGGIDQHAH
ncbi:MAG: glycosyltransferase [Thermoguttaceae bacterium]